MRSELEGDDRSHTTIDVNCSIANRPQIYTDSTDQKKGFLKLA